MSTHKLVLNVVAKWSKAWVFLIDGPGHTSRVSFVPSGAVKALNLSSFPCPMAKAVTPSLSSAAEYERRYIILLTRAGQSGDPISKNTHYYEEIIWTTSGKTVSNDRLLSLCIRILK